MVKGFEPRACVILTMRLRCPWIDLLVGVSFPSPLLERGQPFLESA